MSIDEYITSLRKRHNIIVTTNNGELKIMASREALTQEIVADIRSRKPEIIDFFQSMNGDGSLQAIPRAPRKDYYRLSAMQQRVYFMYELDRSNLAYNMPMMVKLEGILDHEQLRRAFQQLIQRHTSLRTFFTLREGTPVQVVMNAVELPLVYYEAKEQETHAIITSFIQPFDLHNGPLLRIGLIALAPDEHILMLDMHHIITDGLSISIMLKEFMALYKGDALSTLPLQYIDFCEWQQSPAYQQKLQRQKKFWLQQFPEKPALCVLPTDFPRPALKTHAGALLKFEIGVADTAALKALAAKENTTLYFVLLSIYHVFISKLNGQQDLVIGSLTAGRNDADLDGAIGMFVNTVPLRIRSNPNLPFKTFLHQVKQTVLECFDNPLFTYYELIEELGITLDPAYNPLFDLLFSYQNFMPSAIQLPGLAVKPLENIQQVSKYDLSLIAGEAEGQLFLSFEYSTQLFKKETIEQFINCFTGIVSCVLADPGVRIEDLDLLREENKRVVFDELKQYEQLTPAEQKLPASFHQERLWFIDQFETGYLYEGAPVYHNIPLLLRLKGALDVNKWEQSFRHLFYRYDILRTRIITEVDKPFQQIDPVEEAVFIEWYDEIREEAFVQSIMQAPFSPGGRLVRACLIRVQDAEHQLVIIFHHLIADRYSMNQLARELLSHYHTLTEGKSLSTERPALQYGGFSLWQQRSLPQLDFYLLNYWKRQLGNRLKVLEFPTDRPRAAIHIYTAAQVPIHLPEELVQRAWWYAQQEGIQPDILFMSVFKILLHKYSLQEEIVIGTPVDNRNDERLKNMIGPVANLIVIRSFVQPDQPFHDYVKMLAKNYAVSLQYGYMPFDKLVLALAPEKDMSRTALFDVLFQYENTSCTLPSTGTLQAIQTDTQLGYGKYDLSFFLQQEEQVLQGQLVYNADYFDAATMQLFVEHYCTLLEHLLANPHQLIADATLLSNEEKTHLLQVFDYTHIPYPADTTIVDLFVKQATLHPEKTAIVCENDSITYGALHHQSDQLALLLQEVGVGKGAIVALLMDRSIATVTGMLGILKAGGAYLPIDVHYPTERIDYLVKDSSARWIVTTKAHTALAPVHAIQIFIEDALHTPLASPITYPCAPDDLCYIIYTSGTTGNPKGVMIEHRNVVRLLFNDAFQFDFNEADVWTMSHSHCFDFSVWEIYGALLYGGRLVIIPRMLAMDTRAFMRVLRHEGVTVLNQTPSAFYNLVREELQGSEANLSLRYVIFGGEALSPGKLKSWRQRYPSVRLINMYGITETTVHVTYKEIDETAIARNASNIGKPIPTLSLLILDAQQRLTPPGVMGELYVGGAGLARGYWGKPELTQQKFVRHPFKPGEYLYRSGDLARMLSNGEIEYIGRADHQVQLRGFRIELGEIESQLNKFADIQESVVIVSGEEENKYLTGYYVAAQEIPVHALRSFLSDKLPDYMIPAYFVQLQSLPLTSNGKLDRDALPAPLIKTDDAYTRPCTEEETVLVNIWQQVLGLETVGVTDNFFLLGGDSIKSLQISSRLLQAGYEVSVKDIFSSKTIKELATKIRPLQAATTHQHLVEGPMPLSPIQHWFFRNHTTDRHHFNQSLILEFAEGITVSLVQTIFRKLILHHDALRIVFKQEDDQLIGYNKGSEVSLSLVEYDLTGQDDPDNAIEPLADAIQSGIDLTNGPLLKLGLFHVPGGSRLLIVIHHLVIDTVSWRIVLEDLETLYRQAVQQQPLSLPVKTDAYQQYSVVLNSYIHDQQYQRSKNWWNEFPVTATVPQRDHPAGNNFVENSSQQSFWLDTATTALLLTEAHKPFSIQVQDLLLTALLLSIKEREQQTAIQIDLEGHGRESVLPGINCSRTVGWFTSIFPVLLSATSEDLSVTIREVKEAQRKVPDHGIGYLLYRYLDPEGKAAHDPTHHSRILFNYLGQFENSTQQGAFTVRLQGRGREISPRSQRPYDWELTGLIAGGQLELTLTYSCEQYLASNIASFLETYEKHLRQLITWCAGYGKQLLSPSDLTYKLLPLATLDEWQQQYAVEDVYPLSFMQEGMFFHAILQPDARDYFEQMTCRLHGPLQVAWVQQSLQLLMHRHEVLRTVFIHEGFSRPLQMVLKERPADVSYYDVREACQQSNRETVLQESRLADSTRGMDLGEDVLLRVSIFRTGEEDYDLLWSHHHIIMDGWCLGIILHEFAFFYSQLAEGKKPVLAAPIRYATYIEWLEARDGEAAANYWKNYLCDYEQLAAFPGRKHGVNASSQASLQSAEIVMDQEMVQALNRFCGKHSVTLSTVIQCAWGLLLARYQEVDDVVFGTVVSGRPPELRGVENMVGLFINTLPVRIQFHRDQSLVSLLQQVQQQALTSEQHQYLSLAEIQSYSQPGRFLMDHIIVIENYPIAAQLASSGFTSEYELSGIQLYEQTNYEAVIVVVPGNTISIKIDYNINVYSKISVERVLSQLQWIIHQILTNEDGTPAKLTLSPVSIPEQLLPPDQFEESEAETRTVLSLIQQKANSFPDQTVLVCEKRQISYGELQNMSGRIAAYLQQNYNVHAGDLVGIVLPREEWLVPCILGILLSGAAYIPIDTQYPPERIQWILNNAGAKVLITRTAFLQNIITNEVAVINLDTALHEIEQHTPLLTASIEPDHLAYVIYTSGSTGQPKGVMISHASLFHYIHWAAQYYVGEAKASFPLYTSIAFDLTITSIFVPLVTGNTIILYPENEHRFSIEQVIEEELANVIKLTPSHLKLLLAGSGNNRSTTMKRRFIVGGEQLETWLTDAIYERFNGNVEIYNEYGPTEATVGCMIYQYQPGLRTFSVPVGKAIVNTGIYLLDRYGQPAPSGMPAEMYITGRGLAKGYLHNETLTRERFVPDPFRPGHRMYKTGDKAMRLPEGDLEYLGRLDDQVKIRGYRIEPAEIAFQLQQHPRIEQTVVLVQQKHNEKLLVAWYTASEALPAAELQTFLSNRLPSYMIPAFFVFIRELPLTVNGKIRKEALPDPVMAGTGEKALPINITETYIRKIWSDILDLKEEVIGTNDDFFGLGGHSIKAVRMIHAFFQKFQVTLPLKSIFDNTTIAKQALLINNTSSNPSLSIPPAGTRDHYIASSAQERLFYEYLHNENNLAYNISGMFMLANEVNIQQLRRAFTQLQQRHEGLRTTFFLSDDGVYQQVNDAVQATMKQILLQEDDDPAILYQQFIQPFSLQTGPLIRTCLLQHPAKGDYLLMDVHHIICDGLSLNILMNDFKRLYQDQELPALPLRYVDYANWQRNLNGLLIHHEEYWRQQLTGYSQTLNLPRKPHLATAPLQEAGACLLELDAELYSQVKAFAASTHVTEFMFLLSVYYLLIARISGNTDLIIGTDVTGRPGAALENIVGTFVNILPLRMQLDPDTSFHEFLQSLKVRVLEGYQHQDYPFDAMQSLITAPHSSGKRSFVQLHFAFVNFFTEEAAIPTLTFTPVVTVNNRTTQYEFKIEAIAGNNGALILQFIYSKALYDDDTIQLLSNYYKRLLLSALQQPNNLLHEIQL